MTAWMDRAACRDADPAIFFPGRVAESNDRDATGSWSAVNDRIAAAKSICDGCPVRAECLDDALSRGDDNGIWGGLTPREREDFVGSRRTYFQASRGTRLTHRCPHCGRWFGGTAGLARHIGSQHEREPSDHGTKHRYGAGCRCVPCCEANAADHRARTGRVADTRCPECGRYFTGVIGLARHRASKHVPDVSREAG